MKRLPLILLLALLAPAAGAAGGGSLQVLAVIQPSCTTGGTLLNFGDRISPSAADGAIDASTSLSVRCTNSTPYSVGLSSGTSSGGTRAMRDGLKLLPYELYLDPARSKIWGDGGQAYSGTGTGSVQNLTIYGRLPSLAGIAPGHYSDTVTVTISY